MYASRKHRQKGRTSGLVPDFFADSVQDIDFGRLHRLGVRYLALDVDQTLTHHRGITLDDGTREYLSWHMDEGHIEGLVIASNSLRDLQPIAADLDARIVHASLTVRKPGGRYFAKLLRTIGCQPHQVAMVGDRLMTDIVGANRAGMTTVLVHPYGPDSLLDRLVLRRFWGQHYLRRQRS